MRALNWKLQNPAAIYDPSLCTIHSLLGRQKPLEGQVGIEVEVEGNSFPKNNEDYGDDVEDLGEECIPYQWRYTHDGSLRGDDNAEYILAKPLNFNEVSDALKDLWQMFSDWGSVLDESNRTSVHVHLNAQSWHLNRLASFLGLYFSVEEILVNWCGDHRAGNLFCLRAKDAPAIINRARKFIKTADFGVFDDGQHYAGVNLEALRNKGSIEIRCMRGSTEYQPIETWVKILERIYNLSGEFEDPRLVVAQFSGGGPLSYLRFVLGDLTDEVLAGVEMGPGEVVRSLTEGIRFAQNICYCRDWSSFKPNTSSADPFGRSPVKVASSINNDPVQEYLSLNTYDVDVPPAPQVNGATLAQAMQDFYAMQDYVAVQAVNSYSPTNFWSTDPDTI